MLRRKPLSSRQHNLNVFVVVVYPSDFHVPFMKNSKFFQRWTYSMSTVIIGVLFCVKTKTGPSCSTCCGCATPAAPPTKPIFLVDALPWLLHFCHFMHQHLMKHNICKTTSWHEPPWNHDIWMNLSGKTTPFSNTQDASLRGVPSQIFPGS